MGHLQHTCFDILFRTISSDHFQQITHPSFIHATRQTPLFCAVVLYFSVCIISNPSPSRVSTRHLVSSIYYSRERRLRRRAPSFKTAPQIRPSRNSKPPPPPATTCRTWNIAHRVMSHFINAPPSTVCLSFSQPPRRVPSVPQATTPQLHMRAVPMPPEITASSTPLGCLGVVHVLNKAQGSDISGRTRLPGPWRRSGPSKVIRHQCKPWSGPVGVSE